MKNKKHEPIIWNPSDNHDLHDFFMCAKGLELNYVIYVIDAAGKLNSIWSCSPKDFNECMFTFSNKCYFGRVQSIDVAIEYGFFDEIRAN